jgi:hypothetical protein
VDIMKHEDTQRKAAVHRKPYTKSYPTPRREYSVYTPDVLHYYPDCIASDDRMINECGAVSGMRIGRGNRTTRRKKHAVPLCPLQITHDLN